jgi:hypothetical protein
MFIRFLILQWKSARRASIWQKNLIINVIIGFFLLLFLLYLLLLGLLIDKIIRELSPGRDPLQVFNGILLYYFLFDILIRFMMQPLPRINIESFLHLPVRKSSILHYMTGRTILDIFNLIPLCILIPVLCTLVIPESGNLQALSWILSCIFLMLGNNFFTTYLKRLLGTKPLIIVTIGSVLGIIVLFDRIDIISLTLLSSAFFRYMMIHPVSLLIGASWMIMGYLFHYYFLKGHLYSDSIQSRKNSEFNAVTTSRYLSSMGITGTLIMLEMKLYWRNKRTRTIIYLLPVFILYGLLVYPDTHNMSNTFFLVLAGIFITGGLMLNYLNYAFGYESNYFDTLLTKPVDFKLYIRTKFQIAAGISTISYIFSIPYVYFGTNILLINTVMYLYNIGIYSYVLIFFATYNKKRFDLTRGASFNYQGISGMNWIAMIPAFIFPLIFIMVFNRIGLNILGLAILGLAGISGLLLNRFLVNGIIKNFYRRKYVMAGGFRERS